MSTTLSIRSQQLIARLKRDDQLQFRFSRATSGETGVQCFDEWANELTGHSSPNHSRMWFASIWIFWLGLPWQLGAIFSCATCSTVTPPPILSPGAGLWIANQRKTYIARPDNIAKFTRGRFRPNDVALAVTPPISGPPIDPKTVRCADRLE